MHDIVGRVNALVPFMRRNAARFDADASFPAQDIVALREAGALRLETGEGDSGTDRLASMLSMIGAGNLSVGRIFEAHVNAIRLVERYGTSAQRLAVLKARRAGELFALWVTDPPAGALRMIPDTGAWRLQGSKMFCSAAGHVDHAVVTATLETGEHQMILVPCCRGEKVRPLPGQLHGMRAAVTGTVDFTGLNSSSRCRPWAAWRLPPGT
jgi:alkylation response protein AidB-like acyl-CoA dehydrogenase